LRDGEHRLGLCMKRAAQPTYSNFDGSTSSTSEEHVRARYAVADDEHQRTCTLKVAQVRCIFGVSRKLGAIALSENPMYFLR
jgi:hypothetical protein